MAFATAHPIRLLLVSALVLYGLLLIGFFTLFGTPDSAFVDGDVAGVLARVVIIPTIVLVVLFAVWRRAWTVGAVLGLLVLTVVATLAGHIGIFERIRAGRMPAATEAETAIPAPHDAPTTAGTPAPATRTAPAR